MPEKLRIATGVLLATLLGCSPAHALVTWNDSKEHVYVTGTATMAYDSNIFSSNGGGADSIYSAGLLFEYTRRAGWIGVNGSVALDASHFGKFQSESFANPKFRMELTKTTGRTTGSITMGAARESRADTSANLRTNSWNYDAGLSVKYPVIDRYTISADLGFGFRDYEDNRTLYDLKTYSAAVDLFYAYKQDRDLFGGYRFRNSESVGERADGSLVLNNTYDHSFSAGVAGRVISRLNGSLRVGYGFRTSSNARDGTFHTYNGSGTLTWAFTRKLNLSNQISKDFSTTATNVTVDSTMLNSALNYAYSAKLSGSANVGWGDNRFLGPGGLNPPFVGTVHRHDHSFTWGANLNFTLNEHFKASLAYSYMHNWSNVLFSSFERSSFTLTLISRW